MTEPFGNGKLLSADQPFLQLQNISKHFAGVKALSQINFDIHHGEIHCLAGENGSGKSTLIQIIAGALQPDQGGIISIDGRTEGNHNALDAIHQGIAVIYQDLSLFPNLSVAENIALSGIVVSDNRFVNWKKISRTAQQSMNRIGVSLPLKEAVENLSVGQQQLVAICRSLTHNIHLLIMDEPTAALTPKEVNALLNVIRELQQKNIASLFISHKLDEIMQIAQRMTVLRDGKKIGTFEAQNLDSRSLSMHMTGRDIESTSFTVPDRSGTTLLEVKNLGRDNSFDSISFKLRAGEILGMTGLLGAGRTELATAIFGTAPAQRGEIRIKGEQVKVDSVQTAIARGIAYVPENRLAQGLAMPQSVTKNALVTITRSLLNRAGLLDKKRMYTTVMHYIQKLAIKTASVDTPVQLLSGGNQQKVVLAKWLASKPSVLILDGPTVGIDIAAKQAIHKLIHSLAADGMGIILISDELSEVLRNSSRLLIMHQGKIAGEFDSTAATEEQIQKCISSAAREFAA